MKPAPIHRLSSLVFFLLAVCLIYPGTGLAKKSQPAEEKQPPKKVIAIVPIQKAMPAPLYLSTQPGLFKTIKESFKEKKLKLGKQVSYDPEFVPSTLGTLVADRVLSRDFWVYTPSQVEPIFEELALQGKEFSVDELTERLKADAVLLITLTAWDAENFDRSGTIQLGFEAALVDVEGKRVVWSNQASNLKLKTSSDDFLYEKYQREILGELAGKILRGFPKSHWSA